MRKRVYRFLFADGTTEDIRVEKVRDDRRDQLEELARLTGDSEPLERMQGNLDEAEVELMRTSASRKKGNKNSAEVRDKNAREKAEELKPIYDEAYGELEQDCPARIGRGNLYRKARQIVNEKDPQYARRDEITKTSARAYLEERRKPT